jgi:hypothetical protein
MDGNHLIRIVYQMITIHLQHGHAHVVALRQFVAVWGRLLIMTVKVPCDLREVMRSNYDDLINFVVSEPFKSIIEEMYSLPLNDRPNFVQSKILNEKYLNERDVIVPEGILIQRSSFGDRRPTLFVVKKYLPKEYQVVWENVNITFDQTHENEKILRDASAWRKPLPFQVQSALQCLGMSVEELEECRTHGRKDTNI